MSRPLPTRPISNSTPFRSAVGAPSAVGRDPFEDERSLTQYNTYGHSVNIRGETSGALLSRQQQESLQSKEAAGMLLDALEKYGPAPGARVMLDWEKSAALNALSTGVYVSWRSPKGQDCTRVGPHSMCFCGHLYSSHGGPFNDGWKKNKMACDTCACTNYSFIPQTAEEAGEWWLPRRKDFKPTEYKAKCKCKHAHTEHEPKGAHRCTSCGCGMFNSAFLCVVCDHHSESHETVWETESERIASNRPTGAEYLPFAEAPEIAKLVYDRKRVVAPRPGEKKSREPASSLLPSSSSVVRTRPSAKSSSGLKAVTAASAQAVGQILKPATTAPDSMANTRTGVRTSAMSSLSSSSLTRPFSTDTLTRQMASHSLRDHDYNNNDGHDADDDDPFAVHDSHRSHHPSSSAIRSTAAGAVSNRPPSSSSTSASSRASTATPAISTSSTRTNPSRVSSSSGSSATAANNRAQRQAFEAQLMSNVKQASSSFKPVFD